jgi:hypothetical protein
MTLEEALNDENLFAPHFRRKSWKRWRVFLRALFAEAALPDDLALFQACTGRTAWPTKAVTEAAVIVGRRGGKSRILAVIATHLATMKDYSPYLAPGEVATIGVLAQDRKQARAIFRFVLGGIKDRPLLASMIVSHDAESMILNNRVVIEISTASFRSTRGYSYGAVLCDELAIWRSDEDSANPDVEILRALRPGLANIPGAMLLMASSPYAKKGELYNAYRRHYGKDDARVLVWKADTATMNPAIDKRIIEEAYAEDPEGAKAEFGAEFRDDLADFVTREIVDAVTCWGRSELPPQPGIAYSAFCDPSGGISDAMTVGIAHLGPGDMCVLDMVWEARPPFNPEQATATIAQHLRRYSISTLTGDHYAGGWPIDRFREHGIEFVQSARPKSAIYQDLLPLLNARRVELLDNPRLIAQLCSLERHTAGSGKDSITHPKGGHDDLINAVAGALVGIDLDRRPPLVRLTDVIPAEGTAAVTEPDWYRFIYMVVFQVEADVAVVWCGANLKDDGSPDLRLWVLDVDTTYLRPGLWADLGGRIDLSAKRGPPLLYLTYAPAPLAAQLAGVGYPVTALEEDFDPEVHMAFAMEILGKRWVTFCAPVVQKMKSQAIGAALTFKAGDKVETALRAAFITAIWNWYNFG